MTMTSINWSDYFRSRADNEQRNQNSTIYTAAWSHGMPRANKLALLTNEPNTVIFAADTEGDLS